ncbi:mucin TcMUCII, putative, partial [Trypanosoma cruzi]
MKVCRLQKQNNETYADICQHSSRNKNKWLLALCHSLRLFFSVPLLRWFPGLHEVECAEYERRPMATELFLMNIGCTSRGPTIHVVCGDHSFLLLICFLCCCVRCTSSCVCAPSVRGADMTDRSRRMCACGGALCAAPVCFSLFHLCVGVAAGLCVCACCRGLECVLCVVCGVRCMPGCCPLLMWCALCVCLLHLLSPLLLFISLTVQIGSTPLNDHTHDDDDVPSAVRPVGACLLLLP